MTIHTYTTVNNVDDYSYIYTTVYNVDDNSYIYTTVYNVDDNSYIYTTVYNVDDDSYIYIQLFTMLMTKNGILTYSLYIIQDNHTHKTIITQCSNKSFELHISQWKMNLIHNKWILQLSQYINEAVY